MRLLAVNGVTGTSTLIHVMPITFFSPSLVRVVRHHPPNDTEHTITIPQSSLPERPLPTTPTALSSSIAPSSHIIGAISCARDTLPYILLVTSDAFLYKIPLTQANIDVSCICNGTNNTTRRFKRERLCDNVPGVLYSITALPSSSTQRERDSHVLIHGSLGNILFSPHSPRRQVLNVSTISATAATSPLLLNEVVAYASYVDHVKAFVCASVTGVVFVCRAPFDKFQKVCIDGHGTTGAQHQSMQTVAQMFQRPLCMLSTLACDVIVVVGINGDVVVVYVGSSNGKKQLCTKRTFIELPDDDNGVMSGVYLRAKPIGQHSLSISVRSSGNNDASLKVEYNSETYCLTVAVTYIRSKPVASDDIIDVDRLSASDDGDAPESSSGLAKYRRGNESDDEKIGVVLKQLLSDIERIGFSYTTACIRRTELHRQLRSYNAALTFASVARHHCQDSTKPVAVECEFSLHLTPTRTEGFIEFEHEHKMPVHGRAVFLSIALCNRTDVALADGWGLHVQVAQTQAVKNREATLCEMRADLRQVIDPRGGQAVMCFPLTLQSHSPLSISAYLRFKQVSVSGSSPIPKTTNNDMVDVRLTLCRNARVDILHMSTLADAKAIKEKDKSHKWVSSVARSVADASSKNTRSMGRRRADSERTKNHPVVHRFQVPLDRRRLHQLLRSAMIILPAESNNIAFKTILDGRFSLSLDDHHFSSSLEQHPQQPGFHPCNVTIHGLGHIVPFVRAAITHRVIEHISTTAVPFDIQIHGATYISTWHKRLLDMTDEYTKDVRDAQASLVAVVRVLRAIALQQNDAHEKGTVQILDDANDECDAMLKALTATCRMWDRWRHALEEQWSPSGMKYTERAPTPAVVNVDR